MDKPSSSGDVLLPCIIGLSLLALSCSQQNKVFYLERSLLFGKNLIEEYQKLSQRMVDFMNKSFEEQNNEGEEWKK